MNLLLPRSDRRRFFLLSDFQSNALHGDIHETLTQNAPVTRLSSFYPRRRQNRSIMPPFPSAPSSPETNIPQNVAAGPPLIPLLKHKPLKSLPQASSYPSPATKTPQNVAAGLLLSLSGNEYPSKRCRKPPLIPLRKRKSTQNVAGGFLLSLSSAKTPQNVAAWRGGSSDPSARHLF